ncbi:MAG: FAD-dependent thymidylate synthase [bacterium]|nr:FAD-dependent thymidylate synthase [bacterium]MDA1024458.1 FAD-dependent thymidylate synthase [bacterium]
MNETNWIQTHKDDRCVVFKHATTGEEHVCVGDGHTLPYRQFIERSVFEMAKPFFLSPESNITAVDGRKLSGLIGAMLARQSRAPGTTIDVLVNEFLVTTEDEARELGVPVGGLREGKLDALIERILIQYGDDSVQELESATVLFNSVSNLTAKMVEDRRLGAYIEQSSRYVLYTEKDPVTDNWYYYRDQNILSSPLGSRYVEVLDKCFQLYSDLADQLQDYYRTLKPLSEVEYAIKPNDEAKYKYHELEDDRQRKAFKRSYTFDIRTRACDTARIMLPAATLTNLAMVANGRTFEHLLKRLYSSGRPEFIDVGNRLHDTLNRVIPKYVKRADRAGVKFWQDVDANIREDLAEYLPECNRWSGAMEEVRIHEIPRLISKHRASVEHLLAAIYFPYAKCDYEALVHRLSKTGDMKLMDLLRRAVGERSGRRDRSPRGFEHGYDVTVEVVADFGVFRDLHRHRMCTLQWQRPTPHLGFEISDDIVQIGMDGRCREVEREVRKLYDQLTETLGEQYAEYVVLFGHNIRFMIGMNLREAQHMLEIRSIMQGHPNYRRVAQKIHDEIRKAAPWIDATDLLKFVDHNQYHWARSDAEARQSQKAIELGLDIEV